MAILFFSSLENPSSPVPSGHIGGLEILTTKFPLSLLLSKSSLSGILLLVNQRKGKRSYDVSGQPPGVPSTIAQLPFLLANQAAKSSFSFWWLLRELSPEAQGKLLGDFPIVVEGRRQNGLRFLLGWLRLFFCLFQALIWVVVLGWVFVPIYIKAGVSICCYSISCWVCAYIYYTRTYVICAPSSWKAEDTL